VSATPGVAVAHGQGGHFRTAGPCTLDGTLVGDTGAPCGTGDEETTGGEGKERGDGAIHGTA
jgi:hypothetical protein